MKFSGRNQVELHVWKVQNKTKRNKKNNKNKKTTFKNYEKGITTVSWSGTAISSSILVILYITNK